VRNSALWGFSAIGGQAMSKRRWPHRTEPGAPRACIEQRPFHEDTVVAVRHGRQRMLPVHVHWSDESTRSRKSFPDDVNECERASQYPERPGDFVRGIARKRNIDSPFHETLWKSQRHECDTQRRNGGDSAACKDLVRRLAGCACADPASRTCSHPNTGEFRAQVEISSCGDSRGRSAERARWLLYRQRR